MQLVSPDYLFTSKGFVKDHSFVFNDHIVWAGKSSELPDEYKDIQKLSLPKHSCITPGLINAHVHLEFSANKTSLKYGRFMPWLYSVIQKRDEIIGSCQQECLEKSIKNMIKTGTTAFGAVSSYATDMDACINTPAKVVFFNELIGSNATMADALWGDFLERLEDSKKFKSKSFFPAIAVHSPYSVHPILVQKAVNIAIKDNLPLTAHLLESDAEREWLTSDSGEFAPFFKEFLQQDRAVSTIPEFISAFNSKATLFTHATKLTQQEAKMLQHNQGHTIIHCPISNRLLGNGVLDLKNLYEHNIDYVCGTDGLSSNYSLDLFEELKAALYMHNDADLDTLSLSLLHASTTTAGKHLGLNSGIIEAGFDADFLCFDLENELNNEEDLALHIILKNYPLKTVFISGKKEHHA